MSVLTVNHGAEDPAAIYGRVDEQLETSTIKYLIELQFGRGSSELSDEDKENILILVCHRSERAAQALAILIFGESKTREFVEKRSISYLVEALLPVKDKCLDAAGMILILDAMVGVPLPTVE